MLAFEWDLARVWKICVHDRRMRAAVVAYFLSSVSIVVLQPLISSLHLVTYLAILTSTCVLFTGHHFYMYSMQALFLGMVSGSSITIGIGHGVATPKLQAFCLYAWTYANFHFFEFFMTGLTNAESLRSDSFLLNHSAAYWVAAVASWAEFLIEAWLFPNFYSRTLSLLVGFSMCLCGEVFRKLAMCHAAAGFTHRIAFQKRKNHVLVTSGIYSLCRHPGYLGWLLWSMGTQVILCNPVCCVAYTYVVYHFFVDRIREEEKYLIEFFGQSYIAYAQRVPCGIPFVIRYSRSE